MYNNFLAEKNKKDEERQSLLNKRLCKWLYNYKTTTRPELVNGYAQRVNSFITKLQQNPKELNRFEAPDVRQQKEVHIKERLSEMEMKGGRMFKFRDTTDFISFFGQTERIERNMNLNIFQKRYGNSDMACRSIASQSEYNPKTEFRIRDKSKEINPPMKYTNKISPPMFNHRKSKSVISNKRRSENIKTEMSKHQEIDHENVRRSTSVTNSAFGDDLTRSVISAKADSQSSQESYKNLKKFNVTLKDNKKLKKNESRKTYFVGIADIKLNSKDPHMKKTLQNILVKIGKNRPNYRDKNTASNAEALSSEMG